MHMRTVVWGGVAVIGLAGSAGADVIVRLDSGSLIRATNAWREGDTVRVAFRSGVATFPAASVVSIEEPGPNEPAPMPRAAVAPPPAARQVARSTAPAAAKGAASQPKPASGPKPTGVDESIPQVAGEDSQTKLDRLDALSMQTHRQLSVARTQGQPQETLDALQRKIEAINGERMLMIKKLGR